MGNFYIHMYVCMYVSYVCMCVCVWYVCIRMYVCVCVRVCMYVLFSHLPNDFLSTRSTRARARRAVDLGIGFRVYCLGFRV